MSFVIKRTLVEVFGIHCFPGTKTTLEEKEKEQEKEKEKEKEEETEAETEDEDMF